MSDEYLEIKKDNARLTILGKSWPDTSFDSGDGGWDDTYDGTYDGEIPRTDLPVRIEVTKPPNKTEYEDHEPIDFTGLVVTAYAEDGSVWTSDDYPDGTIPFDEMLPSIRKAVAGISNVQVGEYVDGLQRKAYFVVTDYVRAEGKYTTNPISLWILENKSTDGAVVLASMHESDPSPLGAPAVSISLCTVSKRVKRTEALIEEGTYIGHRYSRFRDHFPDDFPFDDIVDVDLYAGREHRDNDRIVNYKNKCRAMKTASGESTKNPYNNIIVRKDSFSCNITIPNSDMLLTSGLVTAYLSADTFKTLLTIILYWQRPEDGYILETSFNIFVVADDGNGGR